MAKREGTPKIPDAVREDYWGQGVDLKRFSLCVQGRLWTVLAAALAGALLAAALYAIVRAIHDIFIGKQAQIPVRPQKRVVPGQAYAPFRKTVAAHPALRPLPLVVLIFLSLDDQDRFRRQLHPLRQLSSVLVHRRNQNLQLHKSSSMGSSPSCKSLCHSGLP